MGLFVLSSSSTTVDNERLRLLFVKKGFPPPDGIPMGPARLMFSERPGVSSPTWYRSRESWSLHYVGTLAYRSLGCHAGVKRLLVDFAGDSVDSSELVGSFCIVVFDGSRVRVQTDTAGLCHVFSNREGTIISNSLQAVLVADGRRHTLNRDALLEQLLTGSAAGPDTLFTDIELLTQQRQRNFGSPIAEFLVVGSKTGTGEQCQKSPSECLEFQLAVLRGYFKKISSLANEAGVSLGVSGGYDSRLLLLLVKEAGLPVSAYTYSSRAHRREHAVAEELARHANVELRPVALRIWGQLDSQALAANMDDALYRWDGRTNKTMGTFNDVHTTAVYRSALGSARLNLNGLGGELYRNREHLRSGRLDFSRWLQYFVMGPESTAAIQGRGVAETLVARLGRKYARLMGVDNLKEFDGHMARRWYREVWLPFSAGPRLCAENQASFALMPFADWSVSGEALRVTSHLGTGGAFEAAMIRKLDRRAAGITSNYGHPFDHVPPLTKLSDEIKSRAPLGPRLRFHVQKAMSSGSKQSPGYAPKPPPSVEAGMRILRQMSLPIDWDVFLADCVNRDRCYYIAHFLDSFKEHLSVD